MRITAIRPKSRSRERVDVFVDGELRCSAAADALQRLGLGAGDEVDEPRLAALEREDAACRAREAALSLLSVRARSREEIRRRLARKGFDDATIASCLDRLADAGLLDDGAFASAHVRDRVRHRPRGARLLRQELRGRGVAPDVADEAIADAIGLDGAGENALALEAARAWARRAARRDARDEADERRRLYGYLARRGFGIEAIRAALRVVYDRD